MPEVNMCLLQFALLQITLLSRLQVFLQHVLTRETNAIFSTTQLQARPQPLALEISLYKFIIIIIIINQEWLGFPLFSRACYRLQLFYS